MPGKCEHGLTTRECLVCASPKVGACRVMAITMHLRKESPSALPCPQV